MKKIIVLVLILIMIVSCGGNSSPETKETAAKSDETTQEEIKYKLPDYNFDGYKFNILAAVEQWEDYYYVEIESGDIVDDAVYNRNRAVEELYNISINYHILNGYSAGMNAVATALRGAVNSGTGEFDLAIINVAYISGRILEGLFIDINTVNTINLENPWWLDKINKEITIANKIYTVAGSYSLMSITNAWCMYFNKQLINDYDLDSPYQLVDSEKWTFDKMLEMGSQVCADLNGDGRYNEEDRYGLISGGGETTYSLRYGMGTTITNLSSDGYPVLDGASEKMIMVFEKLKALSNNKEFFYTGGGVPQDPQATMFCSNKGLFLSYPIKITENAIMREFEDYGIIPHPKLNEIQDSYYALCLGDGYSIPIVVNDEDMSGAVLEALNYETYMSVVPQYYEIALQRKFTRDDESSAMLDLIRSSCIMDFGALHMVGESVFNIQSIITGNNDYTTWWAKNETVIQIKLDNIIEQIKELQ